MHTVVSMKKFGKYKHEWKFDLPWHMVDLRDWFYMVNVGHFGDVFLHVRIFGARSLWTFLDKEARDTKTLAKSIQNALIGNGANLANEEWAWVIEEAIEKSAQHCVKPTRPSVRAETDK